VIAFEIGESGDSALEDTAVVPAPPVTEAEGDDEDTLTEVDHVPTVDTAVVSVDEIAAAYERKQEEQAPAPRRRRRLWTRVLSFLIVIALLFGVAYLILWGLAS
jgi:hypothetical protein